MPVAAAGSPPRCPQPPRAVSLWGAPLGAPPRLDPAHVIPWIRQSRAEPLVIPSGVGQGSAPPFLSVLGVTRGDSWGALPWDTAPEGQGTGAASHGQPQDTQPLAEDTQVGPCGDNPGTYTSAWAKTARGQPETTGEEGGMGTPPQGQSAHTHTHKLTPPHTPGDSCRGQGAHGHPGSYTC